MEYQRLTMQKFVEVLIDNGIDLNEINIIADIGAMDGLDSVELKKHFSKADFFLFEGLEDNYIQYLKELEGLSSHHVVLCDFDGKTPFYENHTQGLHSIYPSHWSPVSKAHTYNCHRFDSFISERNIPVPDLLKIDVEGASYDVLAGFGNLLTEVKIIQLETETVPLFPGQKLQNQVFELLNQHGLVEVFNMKCCDGQYDSVFLNSSLVSN